MRVVSLEWGQCHHSKDLRALTLPQCEDTAERCYLRNWPILNLGIRCLSFHPGIKHLKNDKIAHQMPKVYELIIDLL